ncbi:MAG: AraC family transcriptional regulator [Ruminococcaceae bacterium]|nr:AraC family transcriptional regulator [Oscillospiraceae bacterium]
MAGNKRKTIEHSELYAVGIPLIAMYSNSCSTETLESHDHGSFFEICYLKRGTQKYCIGNDEYTINGGEVFITFPREKHSSGNDPQSRGCLYWLHLDSRCPSLLGLDRQSSEKLIESLYSVKTRNFKIRDDIAAKLLKAYNLFDRGGELDIIAARSLLTVFLCELIYSERNMAKKSVISDPISRAKAYMDENIKEKINLDELSEMINFSLSHFKLKFKKEIGIPPGEYIMQRKIYDSIDLLTEKSLTYIAYEYNFSSPQHYSKNFKAVTGMTPKEYKNKMKLSADS